MSLRRQFPPDAAEEEEEEDRPSKRFRARQAPENCAATPPHLLTFSIGDKVWRFAMPGTIEADFAAQRHAHGLHDTAGAIATGHLPAT
mmetsp:Transcript_36187/g.77162  ORF Transcript_36187/g.77162 Transcript_36187/m.77162 type:complete len:88 (-) Transcript_36187:325-588(-)